MKLGTSTTKYGSKIEFSRIDHATWFAEEDHAEFGYREHWMSKMANGTWEYTVDGQLIAIYSRDDGAKILAGGDL